MKKSLFIVVLGVVLMFNMVSAQIGTLRFDSDVGDGYNGDDDAQTRDQFDPFVVIDTYEETYGICYTHQQALGYFTPHPHFAEQSSWTIDEIDPFYDYEYIQSRVFKGENDDVLLCTRSMSNFDQSDNSIYSNAIWYLLENESTISSGYARNMVTYCDYLNSPDVIHFLTINQDNELEYFTSDAVYSKTTISDDNNLFIAQPHFDLTIGENSTPYFCYRVGNSLKLRRYGDAEVTITSNLATYPGTSWGNVKLKKISTPSIAYNAESGKVMVVYSNYDSGTGLWSLYYTDNSDWTTLTKIFNNSEDAVFPHIVADVNSGDFFISFLSFDGSDLYSTISLNVIQYVDDYDSFQPEPWLIQNVGQLNCDGQYIAAGKPVHSVVLPYEEETVLLVASVYFQSSNDTDVRLYEVGLPTTYSCTFRNIVVDEDGGGQLTLTNTSLSSSETFNSGSSRILNTNYNYSIKTLPRLFEDYEYGGQTNDFQHHHWNEMDNEIFNQYKLTKAIPTHLFINEHDAMYTEINSVNLDSSYPIEFHDPWYYDSQTQSQPDDFRTVASGSFNVFLNQNSDGLPDIPIYSLKAEKTKVTTSDILVFTGWSVSNGTATFLDGAGSLETRVVFGSAGATITANYSSAITNGLTVTVLAGETLTLPAGATYTITPGDFKLMIFGKLYINISTTQPVTFQSGAANPTNSDWDGIEIYGYDDVVMQYVTIRHAENPVYIHAPAYSDVHLNYSTIENCRNGIYWGSETYSEATDITNELWVGNNCIRNIGDDDHENPGIFIKGNLKTVVIDSNDISGCYGGIYAGFSYTSNQMQYSLPSEILINHNLIHDLYSDDSTASGVKITDNSIKYRPATLPYGKIVNNTIDGIDGYGIKTKRHESGLWYIKNTIISEIGEWNSGAGYAVYNVGGGNLPVHYSTFYAVEETTYVCSVSNLVLDNPDYVSASDYHLQFCSPCIDAGDPDTDGDGSSWTTDSNDRDPDGTRMDIGALYCDYPPSIPTGFNGVWYSNHPKVYWNAITEPDLKH